MRGRLVPLAALGLAALLAAPPARAALPVPALAGPVVDQAGALDSGDVARLEGLAQKARAAHGGQGVQLQILVVRSLDGEAIEDYAMRVAEAWKLGSRQAGNGVLITVALDDRMVRIDVGEGIEGALTDAQSGRIIRDTLAPAFRAGRYGDGLYQASVQVLGALGALPEGLTAPQPRHATQRSSLGVAALIVLFLLLRIFTGFGGRRRHALWGLPWMGGGFGGGGWRGGGGWGGGGGGWSGGGGGFSGGGASGRW